jgi:hypothetical protein
VGPRSGTLLHCLLTSAHSLALSNTCKLENQCLYDIFDGVDVTSALCPAAFGVEKALLLSGRTN